MLLIVCAQPYIQRVDMLTAGQRYLTCHFIGIRTNTHNFHSQIQRKHGELNISYAERTLVGLK